MENNRCKLYTIGHSTHSLDAFFELLKRRGVTAVADVRSRPYSGRLEHFNREPLSRQLEAVGIKYVFLGQELGARRDEIECYVGDVADYGRIASLPRFREGLSRLKHGARKYQIAIMCAEKEPLDCHRTILICRQLRHEFEIAHILSEGTVEEHKQTERRLVQEMKVCRTLFEPDLSDDDLVQRAYDERARQIAYRTNQEDLTKPWAPPDGSRAEYCYKVVAAVIE